MCGCVINLYEGVPNHDNYLPAKMEKVRHQTSTDTISIFYIRDSHLCSYQLAHAHTYHNQLSHTHVHTYTHSHSLTHTHTCSTHAHTHTHMICTHAHTHTRMHTRTHTHTHVCTHAGRCWVMGSSDDLPWPGGCHHSWTDH